MGFSIGDICKVIDTGLIYTSFDRFAEKAGHPDIIANMYINDDNCSLAFDEKVRVLYVGPHQFDTATMLAIVETIDSPKYLKFIIECKGLKLTDDTAKLYELEKKIQLVLKGYLEGKIIKKMIPDRFVSELLITAMITKNPMDIQFVRDTLLTDKHYERMLYKDGGLLGLISPKRRTLELCSIAVKEEEYAMKFVPQKLRSLVSI